MKLRDQAYDAVSATPVGARSTPPRIRCAQGTALTPLVVSGIVNYTDRGTLAVANSVGALSCLVLVREPVGAADQRGPA